MCSNSYMIRFQDLMTEVILSWNIPTTSLNLVDRFLFNLLSYCIRHIRYKIMKHHSWKEIRPPKWVHQFLSIALLFFLYLMMKIFTNSHNLIMRTLNLSILVSYLHKGFKILIIRYRKNIRAMIELDKLILVILMDGSPF